MLTTSSAIQAIPMQKSLKMNKTYVQGFYFKLITWIKIFKINMMAVILKVFA